MPLQNRVDPVGNLFADAARGLLMGNRGGRLHDGQRKLGAGRWTSKQWICCRLQFKNRRRQVWGNSYTELFFLDEVTAFAAGHRPCFECRRKDAERFARLFSAEQRRARARRPWTSCCTPSVSTAKPNACTGFHRHPARWRDDRDRRQRLRRARRAFAALDAVRLWPGANATARNASRRAYAADNRRRTGVRLPAVVAPERRLNLMAARSVSPPVRLARHGPRRTARWPS